MLRLVAKAMEISQVHNALYRAIRFKYFFSSEAMFIQYFMHMHIYTKLHMSFGNATFKSLSKKVFFNNIMSAKVNVALTTGPIKYS